MTDKVIVRILIETKLSVKLEPRFIFLESDNNRSLELENINDFFIIFLTIIEVSKEKKLKIYNYKKILINL